jgi:hypothetical protein
MVCIDIRLGLPELNAEELANYLSSIENDQPIHSLTGLNAQEIAEEVELFFTGERSALFFLRLNMLVRTVIMLHAAIGLHTVHT